MQLPYEPERFIPEQLVINAIQSLPIKISHALHTYSLPIYHRDPFDRIIIAQVQLEGLPILTSDPQIAKYKVEIIW